MTLLIMAQTNKPVIEAAINGAALMLIAFGAIQITTGSYMGFITVTFGVGLEWFKYWGRRKYW